MSSKCINPTFFVLLGLLAKKIYAARIKLQITTKIKDKHLKKNAPIIPLRHDNVDQNFKWSLTKEMITIFLLQIVAIIFYFNTSLIIIDKSSLFKYFSEHYRLIQVDSLTSSEPKIQDKICSICLSPFKFYLQMYLMTFHFSFLLQTIYGP